MTMFHIVRGFIVTLPLCLVLGACAHRDIKKASISSSANPAEEMSRMDGAMDDARKRDVDLLAPESFASAKKYMKEAHADHESKQSNDEILEDIAYAQAYLERAEAVATQSRLAFQPALESRKAAVNAKANTFFPKQLAAIDQDLKNESENYEDERSYQPKARDLKSLQEAYVGLETEALKTEHLGHAKALIEKAREKNAKRYVPQTLENAEAAYENAVVIIETDRSNVARMTEAIKAARVQAERVFELTTVARDAKDRTPEEIALAVEKRVRELDAAESALSVQMVEGQSMQQALNQSRQNLTQNEQQLRDLKSKEAMQESIEEARKTFGANEADVYQQGNNLLIRLKSMNFSTNRSEIPSASIATLEKVKQVMGKLEPGQVVIEGHTDSVGTADVNQKLSEARAEAIKEFLVSDSAITAEKVETRGLGYEKPISSNKTKSGRAQNRRVDIIISPSGSIVQ